MSESRYLVSCGECDFVGGPDLGSCAKCGYDGVDPPSEGSEWTPAKEIDRLSAQGKGNEDDLLLELVPFLQHPSGCRMSAPRETTGCLCGLDATIDALPVSVARCNGCGRHAVEGGNDDDWAIRERDKLLFCGDCAEALMGADDGGE